MAQLIADYNNSQPTNAPTLSRAIPSSPTVITLAEFGLFVPAAPNKVEIVGTVQLIAPVNLGVVQFQLFRDTGVIYSFQQLLVIGGINTVTFNAEDINAPAGYHDYFLQATQITGLAGSVTATGPISVSGTSYIPTTAF